MDLILWRHAQAHVGPTGWVADEANAQRIAQGERPLLSHAQDLARGLTPKGERQAERMAAWLNQRLPASTRVLASPAQRALQTAQALGRTFKTVPGIDPQASVDDLIKVARWPTSRDPVLLVGHQPALGVLAARLMTGQDLAWSVRKGAVWWLRVQEQDGEQRVTLLAVQSPELR